MEKVEKLAKQIFAECEKDGEPVTYEEAFEMAVLELNAKAQVKHYEQSEKPRKKANKVRKVDEKKKFLFDLIQAPLEVVATDLDLKNEVELSFKYEGENYTLKLTKHRLKK